MKQKEDSRRETKRKRGLIPGNSEEVIDSTGHLPDDFFDESRIQDADMNRRTWLKLVGTQLLMVSMAGCIKKPEKIIPYVKSVEEIVPGEPLIYATALSFDEFARGVLLNSYMGRPTKIEGNPDHPDSLGSTDAVTQALIYQLYDPERLNRIKNGESDSSWEAFTKELHSRLNEAKAGKGEGLLFLSRPILSPSLAFLRNRLQQKYPAAEWHQYSPIHRDMARKAYLDYYGKDIQPVYHIDNADVIFTVQSDFLVSGPGAMAYAHAFSQWKDLQLLPGHMKRMYALESTPTLTGTMADHRIIGHPAETEAFLSALIARIQNTGREEKHMLSSQKQLQLNVLAEELRNSESRSLIIAGAEQAVSIQKLVCHLNEMLNNVGNTLHYIEPVQEFPESCTESLASAVRALKQGRVRAIFVLDGNPVYASPRELDFEKAFLKADFRVYLSQYFDETARLAHWVIPMAHELESWGDTRAFDGTVSVQQPLIDSLNRGKTVYEFCMACLEEPAQSGSYYEMIRQVWQKHSVGTDFESLWHGILRNGIAPGTERQPVAVSQKIKPGPVQKEGSPDRWTLLIRPDPHILDGRFSNNGWLQELPKPFTKLTWENTALVSPLSAKKLGLQTGDMIEIESHGRQVKAPVMVLPGQSAKVMTVYLGYGRKHAGRVGNGLGYDAYLLQTLSEPYQTDDFRFRKTGKRVTLAVVQHHGVLNDQRQTVRIADKKQFLENPDLIRDKNRIPAHSETLYKPEEHLHAANQWAMCIDLNRCTGCGACTMACAAENNTPVVGRKEVMHNREMHWIRVERFYKGSPEDPDIYHIPMPCMHCENAPCELVCPVEATTHSDEGLNQMTYNRCVGTRYCSNNCPYKVRRFNFYEYSHFQSRVFLQCKNPNVTVRSRGIMEKCTYCLQRISMARITAQKENRQILEHEVVTACQQVCPTEAISFGNINDVNSLIAGKKAHPLNYELLSQLGTRPRTSYLARIVNSNPKIKG